MLAKIAWTSPNIPPRGENKITVPGMGRWVEIEDLKVFPDGSWIAQVTTSKGKKDLVDSNEIIGWIPYPYHGPVEQLPERQSEGHVEDWPEEGADVLRAWVRRNCKWAST